LAEALAHEKKLIRLAQDVLPHVRGFYLAGGTAVMLKYHHRISVDLDFFRESSFSFRRLQAKLEKVLPVSRSEALEDNLDLFVGETRISFVYFPFKNRERLEKTEGIPVASDYDLFLNKLYAAGRRVDAKDPWDAAVLYRAHRWPVAQVKADFEAKFPAQSFEIYLGGLLSFEDYPGLPAWVPEVLEPLAAGLG